MTKILGISAKKQGGKTVASNFLFGTTLKNLGYIDQFKINNEGRLVVPVSTEINGKQKIVDGYLDPLSQEPQNVAWYNRDVWPFIKIYSFADYLKGFCTNVLGLTHEQVYGSNADKDSLTPLLWENMPGIEELVIVDDTNPEDIDVVVELQPAKTGQMTARDVMQYFGSDICRRMHDNIWVDSALRRIENEQSELAILCDARFPNEIEGIQQTGGKVIRFLRAPFTEDQHISETALDDYPLEKFDVVIDNREMSIREQCDATYEQLKEWGWLNIEV
jgi:hypothetical protein